MEEVRYHMRYVFENREEAAEKGQASQAFVRSMVSWERVGGEIRERLRRIWAGL